MLAPLQVSELAATAADEVSLAAPAATRVVQDDRDRTVFAAGEVVVVVAGGADPAVVLGAVGEVSGVSSVYGADLEFGIYQLGVEASSLDGISELAASLQQLDGVATAMPMLATMTDQELPSPLDPAGMTLPVDGEDLSDAQRDQWHWAMLDMQAAWELTPGSTDVTIAVVEQGVDRTHDTLRDVLVPGTGPTLNRSFRDVEDRQLRHGTGVASLACSGAGTGGLVGTMQACSLLAVETELTTAMASPDDEALTEYLLYWDLAWYRGLLAAVESGAHVINLSAGSGLVRPESGLTGVLGRTEPAPGCEGERPEDLLLRRAEMRGFFDELDRRATASSLGRPPLFVLAAGNGCIDADDVRPAFLGALHDNVLTVGSVNSDGSLTPNSNFGDAVRLAAPSGFLIHGEWAPERDLFGVTAAVPGGELGTLGHTSAAAPIVAGVAGLAQSVAPELTPAEIAGCLTSTAGPAVIPTAGNVLDELDLQRPFGAQDVTAMRVIDPAAAIRCARDRADLSAIEPSFDEVARRFITAWHTYGPDELEVVRAERELRGLVTEEFREPVLRVHELRDESWANRFETTATVITENYGRDQQWSTEMYAVLGIRVNQDVFADQPRVTDQTVTILVECVDGVGWRVSDLDPFPIER